jgi:hypothetical protein
MPASLAPAAASTGPVLTPYGQHLAGATLGGLAAAGFDALFHGPVH